MRPAAPFQGINRFQESFHATNVSAVLITRGDVDMSAIRAALPFEDIVTVSAGTRVMYDRFLAVAAAKHNTVYTQDDDCIVDVTALLEQYEPGRVLCNMPIRKRAEYPDGIGLIGWGGMFHRTNLRVFDRYFSMFPCDALFERTADRVFTGLNPLKLCDVPFDHLPHAYGSDRMGAQKTHLQDLAEIRQRIYACRG